MPFLILYYYNKEVNYNTSNASSRTRNKLETIVMDGRLERRPKVRMGQSYKLATTRLVEWCSLIKHHNSVDLRNSSNERVVKISQLLVQPLQELVIFTIF